MRILKSKIFSIGILMVALATGVTSAWLLFNKINQSQTSITTQAIYQQKFTSNTGHNSLAGITQDYLVLDFWASWCGPCIESLPYYQKLFNTFEQQQFTWVAVNQDASKTNADNFLTEHNLQQLPVWFDQQAALSRHYGVSGLPTLLLLNKHRQVIYRIVGFKQSEKQNIKQKLLQAMELDKSEQS
ncbi:TlpA family protein disulfide reductase [Catenovulum sp. SX2]|uniref:TlpA family protein disulfide reductase n=1 Tax=Catenovulum sp. SX2 TaxID=3398614 RepID=UPI003F82FA24